ncbi:heme NO-binding domain-containing protein [Saccharicrinis aurantiacus]|uniref:heme NO-binding domain-containing protein n=1 Tax=Saccharicrinis aurantiacus TaxID=1849719 RepID=UPI002491FC21|nr:heme NO-binding domain-containing protein [Saccharicrinis aurantiacus]
MKGIVFTEFLEMVEETFGLEVVDQIIEEANLESEGIYTSVGTYEFSEMLTLISNLSDKVKISINDLLYEFGKFLFNSLGQAHPEVIKSYTDPINMIQSIEDHIHVHVKKLYPDAELPTFNVLEKTDTSIITIYESSRGLYALAHGLMEQAFRHFGKDVSITYTLLQEDGTKVKFEAKQNA